MSHQNPDPLKAILTEWLGLNATGSDAGGNSHKRQATRAAAVREEYPALAQLLDDAARHLISPAPVKRTTVDSDAVDPHRNRIVL